MSRRTVLAALSSTLLAGGVTTEVSAATGTSARERAHHHAEGLLQALNEMSQSGTGRWACAVQPGNRETGVCFTDLIDAQRSQEQMLREDPMLQAVLRKRELEHFVNFHSDGVPEEVTAPMVAEGCKIVMGPVATTVEGARAALEELESELLEFYLSDTDSCVLGLLRGAMAFVQPSKSNALQLPQTLSGFGHNKQVQTW